jgi:hypothetical protein
MTVVSWNASSVPDVSWLNAGTATAKTPMAPTAIPTILLVFAKEARGDLTAFIIASLC